jgi:hypothetical protein
VLGAGNIFTMAHRVDALTPASLTERGDSCAGDRPLPPRDGAGGVGRGSSGSMSEIAGRSRAELSTTSMMPTTTGAPAWGSEVKSPECD